MSVLRLALLPLPLPLPQVWQGKGAILTGRKLLGETDPAKSAPGSIRGDFSIDLGRNIIHGSDGPEGAAHEIRFWFKERLELRQRRLDLREAFRGNEFEAAAEENSNLQRGLREI